jgi:choline dehydrogenase-like flavoprotein
LWNDNIENIKEAFSRGFFCFLATVVQPNPTASYVWQVPNPTTAQKSTTADWLVARAAVRLALKLGDKIKDTGFPLLRGIDFPNRNSGEDVDRFIRKSARTMHYSSSCRMADEFGEAPGVVDDELMVHGVMNLRVYDASVLPRIIATHLQAPVTMVAEKCGDLIKKGMEMEQLPTDPPC